MQLRGSKYFNILIKTSPKIIKSVKIMRLSLDFRQLKRLIAAYKHVHTLYLWTCKLSIPKVPDFSRALTNCQIQDLNLADSGDFSFGNWKHSLDEFKNLIEGRASSQDLRQNLRKINIRYCEVDQQEAEDIFNDTQLENVRIIT
ncbi:unnamed protein product [Moneuplotes crassus]|uniref:Uncharacterized protein n=1 Tax=Euplotes crassus TaxID=5936 RepID=A0AAD1XFJ4_EUPCR|nr:unnamed protein product [Moneuplotes crassus]